MLTAFGAFAASTGAAGAQTIQGAVFEVGGAVPISGAFVSLVDATDASLQATFTSATGTFALSAGAAGTYRLRISRIGYEDWVSEEYRLAPAERVTVRVEIETKPVSLAALSVRVTRSCLDDPSRGEELGRVWEEARKALETAVWAERQDRLRFSLMEYERVLEPRSLALRETESRRRDRVRLPPFVSLPAEELISAGFARVEGDTATYYAPDATALLSQDFQGAYCFGLVRAETPEGPTIGVTFTPDEDRGVVDIEGTLWLDERTAELRRVEYLYVNAPLPRGAERRLVGAELTFARLPDGPFYVGAWWIRFPVSGTVGLQLPNTPGPGPVTGRRSRVLAAYKQAGGSVIDAYLGDRSLLVGGAGLVRGTIRDEGTREPLAGAAISLQEWDVDTDPTFEIDPGTSTLAGVSGPDGSFVIAGVPDGVYAASADHPRLLAARIRPARRIVVVEDGESAPVEFAVLSEETVYRRLCPSSPLDRPHGAIVGFARHARTGVPLPGIRIRGRWRVNRITVGPDGSARVDELPRGTDAATDEEGRFVLCGVPVDEDVFLSRDGADDGVTARLDARILWQDVPVDPSPPDDE